MTFKRLQIINSHMKNPFYHAKASSLSGRPGYSAYYSNNGRERLDFLEIHKPSSLLGFKALTESRCSDISNPFDSLSASFVSQESQPVSTTLMENPFLNAKPFKFYKKQAVLAENEGLSGWEKKKYLQMYKRENLENDEKRVNVSLYEEGRQDRNEKIEPKKGKNLQRGTTYMLDTGMGKGSGIKKSKSLYLDVLDFQKEDQGSPTFYKSKEIMPKDQSQPYKKFSEPIEEMSIEKQKQWDEIQRLNQLDSKKSSQLEEPSLINKLNSMRDSKAREKMVPDMRYQNHLQTNPYQYGDPESYIKNALNQSSKPSPKPPKQKTLPQPSQPSSYSQPQPQSKPHQFPNEIPSTIFFKNRQFTRIAVREIPFY